MRGPRGRKDRRRPGREVLGHGGARGDLADLRYVVHNLRRRRRRLAERNRQMKPNTNLWTMAAALVVAVAASNAASAGVVCVNPAVATCEKTIADGVAKAGPGDIVKIGPGVYYENVDVPAGKDGLQLVGTNKLATIIDAAPYTDLGITHTGAAIVIQARDVQVRNLAVRNSSTNGIITIGAGTLVQGVTISGVRSYALLANASAATGAQFIGNEISASGFGIVTVAYGTVIKSNVIERVSLFGVQAFSGILPNGGDAAQITGNRVTGAVVGITAAADGVVISGNDVRYTTADSIS